MPEVFLSMHVHVVFGTKDGQPSVRSAMAGRLGEQLATIVADQGSRLVACGAMPDHVHLLVALGRLASVDDLVREVKGRSADWIRDTFSDQGRFAWQLGYGAFSVSFSNLEAVREYVLNQEDHHQERTFQQEFITLLRRHQLPHNEHFYWW
jgi:putative transposase